MTEQHSATQKLPHDCDKVIKQIELALDGQLNVQEEQMLIISLEECNYCMSKYKIEKSFKDLIIASIKKRCAPPQLLDRIKVLISGRPQA